MLTENVIIFAGKFLEKEDFISAQTLSKFILQDESVGKALPVTECQNALEILYESGFLDIEYENEGFSLFKRKIPEKKKKQTKLMEKQVEDYQQTRFA